MLKKASLLALSAAVIAIGCSGEGGSGDGGQSCDSQWQTNGVSYTADLLAQLHPIGAATLSNGALVLNVNGTLAGAAPINQWDTGVLYAKKVVLGNFDAQVHLDSFAATSTNFTAFFAVQGGLHGGRVAVYLNGPSNYSERVTAFGNGFIDDGGAGAGVGSGIFHVKRDGQYFTAQLGTSNDINTYQLALADDTPLVVGFGIAAKNYPGGPATGTARAQFSNLVVSTTAGTNCFVTGLN